MKLRNVRLLAAITALFILGFAGTASAAFLTGDILIATPNDLVDTDTNMILGGFGVAVAASGDFDGGSGFVPITAFSYDPFTGPVNILTYNNFTIWAEFVDQSSIVEINGSLVEQVSFVGTGFVRDELGNFDDTAVSFSLAAGDLGNAAGLMRVIAEGDGGGGAGGPGPSVPEPTAFFAYAMGLAVVGRSVRKRR